MSGIAGIIDLTGRRAIPGEVLQHLSDSMAHRGPDGQRIVQRAGLGLVFRHLETCREKSIWRLTPDKGQRIICVLDGSLTNGMQLEDTEPYIQTNHTSEFVARQWEEHKEQFFHQLKGAFSVALWDEREQRLVLGRDRFGVCPLHWTRQGNWLLFASEIKSLLASGLVPSQVDVRGINHVFTFFGVPGPVTCFAGVQALPPGHYLDVQRGSAQTAPRVRERVYWQMDFPDRGQEDDQQSESSLVEQYEHILTRSIKRRLGANDAVVAYSSGGLDSSLLVAMTRDLLDAPIETFTFRVEHATVNETSEAEVIGRHLARPPTVVPIKADNIIGAFPSLVQAAESPVIDAAAAALLQLAQAVGERGHRAVLCGEGADEWQAGYPWFRINKRVERLNLIPGLPLNVWGFRGYLHLVHSLNYPWHSARRAYRATSGHNAWMLAYLLMSTNQQRFYSRSLWEQLGDHLPYDDLRLNLDSMRRWHPLNRSVYMGARVHVPGLHLIARGDRSAMRSSVENRYPFLDEDVYDFLAPLHPRWKLRRLCDKYLQRRVADRWLPMGFSAGHKRLIHSPLDAFHGARPPEFVEQLFSKESLHKTGYFDAQAVEKWRQRLPSMRRGFRRLFVEMGLVGVFSTQLWHHIYIDSSLADLPGLDLPTGIKIGNSAS